MNRRFALVCCLTLPLFLTVTGLSVAQTSVTLNPLLDNTLYETVDGSLSNGVGSFLFSGSTAEGNIRRALISFDIAGSVPAGMTIDSVKLTLNMSRTTATAQTINVHKVLAAWGEGTSNATGTEGMGAPATTNDATWIHTFYSSSFWAAAGGDFSATSSGSQVVGDIGFYTWGSTSGMVADVQGWLDTPSGNFGWILIGNESIPQTSKRFDSGEHATVANRPKLTVYYSDPNNIPCEDIDFFNSKCNSNGAGQAMVRILNSTKHAGKTIEFQLDATVYPVVLVTNGTHTLGKISVPHVGMGMHTMTLITPAGCYDPVTFNCQVDRQTAEADEFDRLWAEAEAWESVPVKTTLHGNYPNPFNPSTTIRYALAEESRVSLKVYNMLGQEVVTLVDEIQSAGERSAVWNGRTASGNQVAAGVYLYTLATGNLVQTSKMIIIK